MKWYSLGSIVVFSALTTLSAMAQTTDSIIDFNERNEGDCVSMAIGSNEVQGIEVFGNNPLSPAVGCDGGDNFAMIFDSACPPDTEPADCSGDDPDLFFPEQEKTLIISEDGISADPDDSDFVDGCLIFDFTAVTVSGEPVDAVQFNSIKVADVENPPELSSEIRLFADACPDASNLCGDSLADTVVDIGFIGNNQIETFDLGGFEGRCLIVALDGSGAVDDLDITLVRDEEPPPEGGEGCTPGYWKQPHHLDSWVDFEPSDDFETVFGVDASFTKTLLGALQQGGGGEMALGRHAVAALLNAANPDVSYAFTVDDVIMLVQFAYETGDFEGVKNTLEAENEQGCPLD